MLYWLMLLCEVLLAGAAVTLTALWSMPAAVILGVFLCVVLLFIRPALRTERVLRERARRVVHGKRLPRVEVQIPVRPSDLEGGEVARLFEGAGLLGERTARRSSACATLLSLDRRGILKIVMEEDKALVLLPAPEQKERLAPYETALLRMFEKAAKGAQSVRLSVFREYASRHIRAMQHALDRADRALTERLLRRGLFVKKKAGKKSVLALSAKGAQQAALWREYYRYLCNAPARQDLDVEDAGLFRPQIEQILVEAEAAGLFTIVRDRILLDYMFEPAQLWPSERVYSGLAAPHSPFRTELYEIIDLLLSYGTSHYHGDDWITEEHDEA